MGKETLGDRIQILRKERKMTQKQLGSLVGVTAQAVSNWECGGAPEAELLPSIAHALGVSIEELFGRKSQKRQSVKEVLLAELAKVPAQKRFERAFELVWMITICAYLPGKNGKMNNILRLNFPFSNDKGFNYANCVDERGIISAFLQNKCHYLFSILHSEEGYATVLKPFDEYQAFFELLGRKDYLHALLYLLSRNHTHFTAEVLAEHIQVTEDKAKEILTEFHGRKWVSVQDAQIDGDSVLIYQAESMYTFLPFFCGLKDLICPIGQFMTYITSDYYFGTSKTWLEPEAMLQKLCQEGEIKAEDCQGEEC